MVKHPFLIDGQKRALEGGQFRVDEIRRQVRQAVEAQYAEGLDNAGLLRRMVLRVKMSREIRRRVRAEIEKFAPRDGMYFSHGNR